MLARQKGSWGFEEFYKNLMDSPSIEISELNDASYLFYNSKVITSFNMDLPRLKDAACMFFGCENLLDFKGNMDNLKVATSMFQGCSSIKHYQSWTPNLEIGNEMFKHCNQLETIDNGNGFEYTNLVSARNMCSNCNSLNSFDYQQFPVLQNAQYMFYQCMNLPSISIDAPILTQGAAMCYHCESLESAYVNTPKLYNSTMMFNGDVVLKVVKLKADELKKVDIMFDNCNSIVVADFDVPDEVRTKLLSSIGFEHNSNFGAECKKQVVQSSGISFDVEY